MNVSIGQALAAAGFCLGALGLSAQTAPQMTRPPAAEPETRSDSTAPLYGRIAGDVYTSPTGAFRIAIPVLPELGGTVTDSASVVTFDDDFSTHCSVGAFPLSPELRTDFESRGTQGFLTRFFTDLVMPDFEARYPGATIEDVGAFLPEFQGGAMLIFTRLPGGSLFAHQFDILPDRKPVVAKRGNLCFVRKHFVFVVSLELAERSLERVTYHLTAAEENVRLRQRLLALVARMQFLDPPEAAR